MERPRTVGELRESGYRVLPVKEEMRRMEGDPIMKQRRRKAQLAAAIQRIRSAVPTADVILIGEHLDDDCVVIALHRPGDHVVDLRCALVTYVEGIGPERAE